MSSYKIKNVVTEVVIGLYEAGAPEEALQIMSKQFGYKNYEDCCRFSPYKEDELQISLHVRRLARL
jgi:hypothetical protein